MAIERKKKYFSGTIKQSKGKETDLCCHWQPKSSKGGERRENSFCPSEGGKER
jgi:hypothetical protein